MGVGDREEGLGPFGVVVGEAHGSSKSRGMLQKLVFGDVWQWNW